MQPPKCPFCGEDTLTEEKRKSIQKEVEENKEILKSLKEFEKNLTTLKIKKNVILKVNSFVKNKSNIFKAIDELKKEEIYKLELQQLNKVIEKYPEIEALRDQTLSELDEILNIFSKREVYDEDLLNEKISILDKNLKSLSKILLEVIEQYYYNKLNPEELIQFKRIKPTSGVRRQAKLEAEAFGKEINPVTCFSEAHMNSLGLSLYFPQRVDYNPEWEFVMLDDPVQSMDDDHTNQLIDILKEKAKTKQIIILTHSSKFRDDIRSRFGKENLLEYEFTQGDEIGPRIELKEGPIKILLQYAKNYAGGIFEERKMAGNNLRQATEKLLAEFLIIKGQNRASVYRLRKEELFKRAMNAGFKENDLRDLDTVLKYADPASHGHDPKDIKRGDIIWGVNKIVELAKKYIPEVSI